MSGDKTHPLDPQRCPFCGILPIPHGDSGLTIIHQQEGECPLEGDVFFLSDWNRRAPTLSPQGLPPAGLREAFVYGMKCARPIESFMGTGNEYYAWIEREWEKSGLGKAADPEVCVPRRFRIEITKGDFAGKRGVIFENPKPGEKMATVLLDGAEYPEGWAWHAFKILGPDIRAAERERGGEG